MYDVLTKMSVTFSLGEEAQEMEKLRKCSVYQNQHAKLPDTFKIQPNRPKNSSR